jgi:hypothetical protein
VFGKAVSGTESAGRLEVVNQYRNIECRMDVGQQVHMIGFAAEFVPRAAPSGETIGERFLEVIQPFRRQRFTAIFRHKNDM